MPDISELSMQLAKIRKESGLSQTQLAELAGLKQSNVARIENGSSVPTLSTMQKILKPIGYKLAIQKCGGEVARG